MTTGTESDRLAADVAWNIETLLPDNKTVDDLLDQAEQLLDEVEGFRGRVGTLPSNELEALCRRLQKSVSS